MVYGHGTGLHRDSMQIPMLMADARRHGHARHVGAGANRWSSVHVADLASLYLHIVQSPGGGDFYYAEGGEHSMGTIAQAVHQALGFAGLAVPITIDQATEAFGELMATYSFGSNCRVRALRARQKLGWAPAMPGLLAFLAGA
jgi:nucleoside-diphosphate-sugar epimerase